MEKLELPTPLKTRENEKLRIAIEALEKISEYESVDKRNVIPLKILANVALDQIKKLKGER